MLELTMVNKKYIKKDKKQKSKKERKPIYKVHGFSLIIPEEKVADILRDMSKTIGKNSQL